MGKKRRDRKRKQEEGAGNPRQHTQEATEVPTLKVCDRKIKEYFPSTRVPIISTAQTKGNRQYNEDRFDVRPITDTVTLLTVCDGHGGYRCAEFAIHWFPNHVHDLYMQALHDHHGRYDNKTEILTEALTSTVEAWDRICLAGPAPTSQNKADALFKNLTQGPGAGSGSTLAACLIDTVTEKMYTISLGDCRVDWQSDRTLDQKIDANHLAAIKPFFPGRAVLIRNRVNGILAIGSAIGNNGRNLVGLINRHPYVSDVVSFDKARSGGTEGKFKVIVASDGLWDTLARPEDSTRLFNCNTAVEMIPSHPMDNVSIIYFQW